MPSESHGPTLRLRLLAWVGVPVVLVLAVGLVFSSALDATFLHWDDDLAITQNQAFRGFSRENVAWMFSTGLLGHFQPLTWLSLALDHTLAPLRGPDFAAARQFHLTNLIAHAACALAVYWASLEVLASALRRRRLEPAIVFASAFAAAFFALHPLRVESVAWVTERRDLLSGAFFALALVAWVRYGRAAGERTASPGALAFGALGGAVGLALFFASVERGAQALAWRGLGAWGAVLALVAAGFGAFRVAPRGARSAALAAFACLVASLGAKAWGMVLPVLFLALDVGPLARARDAKSLVRLAVEKLPFVAIAAAFAALAAWAQALQTYTQPSFEEHTLLERCAQAGFGIVFYPWKTLWPSDLIAIVELPNDVPLLSLRFGIPCVLALASIAAAIAAFRSARNVSLAWFAYLATIAPVLGFLQSGPQLVAGRYGYLATLPLGWVLAAGAARLFARGGAARAVAALVAASWIGALAFAAARQTHVWHDDTTLWTHAWRVEPDGPEIQKNLAFAWIDAASRETDPQRRLELYSAAGDLLQRAATVKLDARVFGNLSLVHKALAELDSGAREEHRKLALTCARRALAEAERARFDLRDYRMNLGLVLADGLEFDEARAVFADVARERPTFGPAWLNLGVALANLSRWDEAEAALLRAAETMPRVAEPWLQIGRVREARGDRVGAKAAYECGLAIAPDDAQLGAALSRVR